MQQYHDLKLRYIIDIIISSVVTVTCTRFQHKDQCFKTWLGSILGILWQPPKNVKMLCTVRYLEH